MKILIYFFSIISFCSCQKNPAERVSNLVAVDYSGNYISVGYFYHPATSRDINKPKRIVSHTSSSFLCEIGDLPSFLNDDSAWAVVLRIDPITNKVTIDEFPNAVNGPGSIIMFPAGLPTTYVSSWSRSNECTNVFDPETMEFKLRYGYYLNNSSLRVIEEIIKKQ